MILNLNESVTSKQEATTIKPGYIANARQAIAINDRLLFESFVAADAREVVMVHEGADVTALQEFNAKEAFGNAKAAVAAKASKIKEVIMGFINAIKDFFKRIKTTYNKTRLDAALKKFDEMKEDAKFTAKWSKLKGDEDAVFSTEFAPGLLSKDFESELYYENDKYKNMTLVSKILDDSGNPSYEEARKYLFEDQVKMEFTKSNSTLVHNIFDEVVNKNAEDQIKVLKEIKGESKKAGKEKDSSDFNKTYYSDYVKVIGIDIKLTKMRLAECYGVIGKLYTIGGKFSAAKAGIKAGFVKEDAELSADLDSLINADETKDNATVTVGGSGDADIADVLANDNPIEDALGNPEEDENVVNTIEPNPEINKEFEELIDDNNDYEAEKVVEECFLGMYA